ncbi:MAG: DNA/RNA non-specific endonuclease [Bacteroidetes bacterium]|nr:DNA/RNA non-specific endonuclease [Bacteroidota bacterium]
MSFFRNLLHKSVESIVNKIYIISIVRFIRGTDCNGGVTNTIANGSITVPNRAWKVIVVLPIGSADVSRVSSSTRVIAVDMPNNQTVNNQTWGFYRTTVAALESATGYDFLSNVPNRVQSVIEAKIDNGPTQ